MPRIRKNLYEQELDSLYPDTDRDSNSSDFLKDPDLLKEPLPQPYRRIDKILQELLDDVCDLIDKKENEKRIEASKPRPQSYPSGSIIEEVKELTCMRASCDEDNEYVFIGSKIGTLYCLDTAGMCILAEIQLPENANIIEIYNSRIKESIYLVVCLSDSGNAFLHVYSDARFFPIQCLIDNTERKIKKIEISKNADYLAALIESKNETSIEVFKCQKETWTQAVEELAANTHVNNNNTIETSDLSKNEDLEHKAESLTKPSLICKIKPSSNQIKFPTAASSLTPAQLFKSAENTEFIGIGVNNSMNRAYLDVKTQFLENVFDIRLDSDSLAKINGTKAYENYNTSFKFFPPNRFMGSNDSQTEIPYSLGVCWNHSNQMLFYPLTKVNKELESKFEYTISFSSPIEQIKLNSDINTALSTYRISFLLKNSNFIVFDLNSGSSVCCDRTFTNDTFKQIDFLSTTTQNINISRFVGLTNSGRVYLIESNESSSFAKCIFEPQLANKDDKIEHLMVLKNLSTLVLAISETKKMFIMNIENGSLICELSSEKELICSDMKEISYSGKNFQIFCKAAKDESPILLCHSLRLISMLDDYLSTNYAILNTWGPFHGILTERMANLMKYRAEEEPMRKQRLNNIWDKLETLKNS